MAGAAAILERTGNENDVTLRAVAREIGISAQSIDRHFANPAQIVDAVVADQLNTLAEQLNTAAASSTDPAENLHAAARAYLAFGRAHPNRYRVLFEQRFLPNWEQQGLAMTATAPWRVRRVRRSLRPPRLRSVSRAPCRELLAFGLHKESQRK